MYELTPLPATGAAELDEVHAQISRQLVSLRAAIADGPGQEAILAATGLLADLRNDFAVEEILMTSLGYPDIELHRAAHAFLETEFGAVARAIRDAAHANWEVQRAGLLRVLADAAGRLAAHVQTGDMALARFIGAARDAGRA